jgi:flavin reductase (DIM6/NTAB) family NADH-FMN oxidoreductase RutF
MSSSAPNPETEAIAQSLGRVPSGLFILVAGDGADRRTGLLASWLQQASFEPPQVTVAVNKSRYLNDWLKLDSPVSINQVPRNDPGLLKTLRPRFRTRRGRICRDRFSSRQQRVAATQ